jgi:hypothetical protein
MLAYVELVQRKEKEIGCDVLTHQKWYVYSDIIYRCKERLLNMGLQEWSLVHRSHPVDRVFWQLKHIYHW